MERISAQELLVLHALVIEETGGSDGVRDTHVLASVVKKPFASFGGRDLYPTLWDKAAIFFEGIVSYHIFVDGNKRTGLIATARFLHVNGYEFTASNKDAELTTLALARKELLLTALAQWLEENASVI